MDRSRGQGRLAPGPACVRRGHFRRDADEQFFQRLLARSNFAQHPAAGGGRSAQLRQELVQRRSCRSAGASRRQPARVSTWMTPARLAAAAPRRLGRRPSTSQHRLRAGLAFEVVEHAGRGHPALVDDDDPVAGHLHLGQDVRREQDQRVLAGPARGSGCGSRGSASGRGRRSARRGSAPAGSASSASASPTRWR